MASQTRYMLRPNTESNKRFDTVSSCCFQLLVVINRYTPKRIFAVSFLHLFSNYSVVNRFGKHITAFVD